MTPAASDSEFTGSIPQVYDRYMVPLIFEPYAVDLRRRVQALRPASVLEVAAGTGVVTRQLATHLPATVSIVATDLNQPMLDLAARVGTDRPVAWRQADAMQLPFDDEAFDVVVCQFGVMFCPDKAKAFAEARRVLRPGGTFLFNAWDRIEINDFVFTISQALDALFPNDPPRFMHRGPHGYADTAVIAQDLARGGFADAQLLTLAETSRAPSPRDPAIAYCQGTPWRQEIEGQGHGAIERATDASAAALADRFGTGAVAGRIQAHIGIARR